MLQHVGANQFPSQSPTFTDATSDPNSLEAHRLIFFNDVASRFAPIRSTYSIDTIAFFFMYGNHDRAR